MTKLNKLTFKWLRPYRVMRVNFKIRLNILPKLDNTEFGGTMAGNRLKFFHFRAKEFSVTLSEKNSEHYNTVKAQNSDNI
jgi:hypothetical protein